MRTPPRSRARAPTASPWRYGGNQLASDVRLFEGDGMHNGDDDDDDDFIFKYLHFGTQNLLSYHKDKNRFCMSDTQLSK